HGGSRGQYTSDRTAYIERSTCSPVLASRTTANQSPGRNVVLLDDYRCERVNVSKQFRSSSFQVQRPHLATSSGNDSRSDRNVDRGFRSVSGRAEAPPVAEPSWRDTPSCRFVRGIPKTLS